MSEEAKAEALDDDEPAPGATDDAEPSSGEAESFITPELLTLLWKLIPAVWLLGVVITGFILGVQVAFLVTAAGVLTLVITLMWSSVQSLTGGASLGFEEALGMGAPSKVEEEKRSVLRALKDLEYERGVGKISPEDYAELSARYRAEAKRLIQSVDEALGPARQTVEKAIEERLERAGLVGAMATAPTTKETPVATEAAATTDAASKPEDEDEDEDEEKTP